MEELDILILGLQIRKPILHCYEITILGMNGIKPFGSNEGTQKKKIQSKSQMLLNKGVAIIRLMNLLI